MATVQDILILMEDIAPGRFSEPWDNSGLQVGDPAWPVRRVAVALDPSPLVVGAALNRQADLLITHHPLIFKAIKSIALNTPTGAVLQEAIRCQMAIFSAHTNLDSVRGGLNDALAEKLGLVAVTSLTSPEVGAETPGHGLGRVGALPKVVTLEKLAGTIKSLFGANTLRAAGKPDLLVRKAALCTGSGAGLMAEFFATDAEVYISGDFKYHDARDAETAGRGLIDLGHFASEQVMISLVAQQLSERVLAGGLDVSVSPIHIETDPFWRV